MHCAAAHSKGTSSNRKALLVRKRGWPTEVPMNSCIGVASCFGVMALLQNARVLGADVETSVAPVCATQKQVERLAGLFAYNTKSAVHVVNVETQNSQACGIVNVAFLRGARIGTVRTQEATFEIVE